MGTETQPWQQLLRCKVCAPAWGWLWLTMAEHAHRGTLREVRFAQYETCLACAESMPAGLEVSHYERRA